MSFRISPMSRSPNWFTTLPMSPDLPTAFFTWLNPCATMSLPPTIPATELVTLPRTLYVVLTAFLPVANVLAKLSTVSSRGYTMGTDSIHRQCWTLGGNMAILGKMPWYVGPASTRFCVRSDRKSTPTTTTAGPRYLTKCQPWPVTVKRSRSWLTFRSTSSVVWCWKSRYMSTATRPMFLNICEFCM